MCGISAIITKKQGVFNFLFGCLEKLQNRGYDSAGICGTSTTKKLVIRKHASDDTSTALQKLKVDGENAFNNCSIGIAHTRWATHGEVNDTNSHPHICYRNKIALVHNGIIENYATIKQDLQSKGISFKSATDSEVVVNLISYLNVKLPLAKAIKKALEMLEGTWAFAIISVDCDMLYFTRHGSSLIMAQTDDEIVVTSEIAGLMTKDQRYSRYSNVVEDKLYQMSANSVLDCETKELNYQMTDVSPFPYTHWTLKEINEQVNLNKTLVFGGRVCIDGTIRLGGLDEQHDVLSKCKNIILLGCGTSYHAGLIGQHFLRKYCPQLYTICLNAAEFDVDTIQECRRKETAVVMISQSGETRDLIKCLEICKAQNVITIGVVNVVESYIARETTCGVYCHAGREVAVASTKSFTAQTLVLVMITLWFNSKIDAENIHQRKVLITELEKFLQETEACLNKLQNNVDYYNLLRQLETGSSMFILGPKGKDMAIALEGALKIKEISYIHCEGTYTGSLKHGPLALITNGLPVLCLLSDKVDYPSVCNAMEEIRCRNGKPILIGNHECADIPIETNNEFGFLWNNMALQLIAYKLSVRKGINPDMPRNLAKVVTVG
jgi:glucosamine--fructose-6-phosphate aminotransferase (isomerizing)